MAVGSRYYRLLVECFGEHGWEARALPRRGFEPEDAAASRHHDWSYADEIEVIAQAVEQARAENPRRPVILLGHSLGAQLAAGHQLTRDPVDAVVTVGGALPYWRDYPLPLGLPPGIMGGVAVPVLNRLFGHVPKPAFGGPGARTLMREWGRMATTGRLPFPAGRTIPSPALLVSLEGDTYAPEKAVRALGERLFTPAATTYWTYRDEDVPDGHSNAHLAWARTPGPVVDRVVAWWGEKGSAAVS